MCRMFITAAIAVLIAHCSQQVSAEDQGATLEFCLASDVPVDNWKQHTMLETDQAVYVSTTPVLTGRDIERISFYKNDRGRPVVGFVLTDDGSVRMWNTTSKNLGKRLAILLDGNLVSAPTIRDGIKKHGVIDGKFDDDDLLRFFTAVVLRTTPAEE